MANRNPSDPLEGIRKRPFDSLSLEPEEPAQTRTYKLTVVASDLEAKVPKLALSHYDGGVLRKYGAYKKGDAG